MEHNYLIDAKNIHRTYVSGKISNHVLKGISVQIQKGEFLSIVGKSGAGKSTLLYQLGLLDTPSEGELFLDGKDTHNFTGDERTEFRLYNLGFVFQDYALLPELNAVENVMLPLLMRAVSTKMAKKQSEDILTHLGLGNQLCNLPGELSGGEGQRVSIARAIVHNPTILFADEPTANLDSITSEKVIDTFIDLNNKGQTIVMITHEEEYSKKAKRIITIKDGLIEKEKQM